MKKVQSFLDFRATEERITKDGNVVILQSASSEMGCDLIDIVPVKAVSFAHFSETSDSMVTAARHTALFDTNGAGHNYYLNDMQQTPTLGIPSFPPQEKIRDSQNVLFRPLAEGIQDASRYDMTSDVTNFQQDFFPISSFLFLSCLTAKLFLIESSNCPSNTCFKTSEAERFSNTAWMRGSPSETLAVVITEMELDREKNVN